MKKAMVIFNISLISVLFFLINIFFESPSNIATFRKYTSPMYKIDRSLIESFDKNDGMSNDYLEKKIIISVLDIIQYDKWKEFVDYIDLNIYRFNLLSQTSQQLILSLNLSKDMGVIVIFEEVENSYIFHSKIDDLAPIENIHTIKHPTKDRNFMAIYQTIDESFGSFFRENFIQIYDYNESEFNLVWEKTMFYEEIYKENWIDIKAPDDTWIMAIEETDIDFDFTDLTRINTITSLKKYVVQSKDTPQKDDFILDEEKSFVRSYYWNDHYDTFILGELTKDTFLSDIAILEDMESKQEWLFGIKNPYYKLSTNKGETIYLPKSKFSKLLERALNSQ